MDENPDFAKRQREASAKWKATPRGKEICRQHNQKKKVDPEKERIRLRALMKKRRAESVQYRIKQNISGHLNRLIKKNGRSTSQIILQRCGYTVDQLMRHLELQFTGGMNWDNYGKGGWHIDHIRPVADFDLEDPAKFSACWGLGNLRPLWGKENSQKGAKLLFLL